ncbi:MAG: DUF1211 domain-containing protein [Methanobacterium sp.]|nr:DUF1211 domain-containing protein [Methanobacterium sp.]
MDSADNKQLLMDTKRLETLVDGIFAIAMTILVLTLTVPDITGPLSNLIIQEQLYEILPNFISIVVSFTLLAVFWNIHHRIFKQIKYVNAVLLWINIIWLFFIVMVPFSASLVGDYGKYPISHIIFNLNLLGIASFLYLNWFFAYKNEFIHEKIDKNQINTTKKLNSLFIGIAIVALIVSFFIPQWAELTYLLIIPLEEIIKRISR